MEKKIVGGLLPKQDTGKEILFGAIYTLPPLEEVPEEFVLGSLENIKEQKETDECAAYAGCDVSEDQEGVELSPEFQFMVAKEIWGDPEGFGLPLDSMAKSFTKVGSIPKTDSPYTVDTARSTIVNPGAWPQELREKAKQYKKGSYLWIDRGDNDFFDTCRQVLYKSKKHFDTTGTLKYSAIVGGVNWNQEWTADEDGVIDQIFRGDFGHALALKGVKKIKGELYLIGKLSNGKDIGDKGIFYFSREVINKGFGDFGGIVLCDMDKDDARFLQDEGIKVDHWVSFIVLLIKHLLTIFKK